MRRRLWAGCCFMSANRPATDGDAFDAYPPLHLGHGTTQALASEYVAAELVSRNRSLCSKLRAGSTMFVTKPYWVDSQRPHIK